MPQNLAHVSPPPRGLSWLVTHSAHIGPVASATHRLSLPISERGKCSLWMCHPTSHDTITNRRAGNLAYQICIPRVFLVAQTVKNLPTMWETWVQSLGWEDSLEEGMAIHSSILAWRIPWIEEKSHGGLQSIESQRVRHNWMIKQRTVPSTVLGYNSTPEIRFSSEQKGVGGKNEWRNERKREEGTEGKKEERKGKKKKGKKIKEEKKEERERKGGRDGRRKKEKEQSVFGNSGLNNLKARQQDCLLTAEYSLPGKRSHMAGCRRSLEDIERWAVTGAAACGELLSNTSAREARGVCWVLEGKQIIFCVHGPCPWPRH